MSDLLEQYRAASPELAKLSDDELIKAVHAASGVGGSPQEYARNYLGVQDKGNFFQDTAADLAKGAVSVAQIGTGAIDLATGGLWSKNAEKAFRGGSLETMKQEIGDNLYSTKRKESNEEVAAAQGFWNSLGAIASNPRTAVGMAVEAAPSMAIPVGVGMQLGKGAVRGAQALGPQTPQALQRASMLGNNVGQTAGWTGVTATQTASRIQAEAPGDTEAMYGGALGAGAVVGALTHGLSFLPGGNMAKQALGGTRRFADSTANQVGQLVGEGVGQTGAENIALGRPVEQGMAEAVAIGLVNAPVFGALGAKKRPDFAGVPREAEGSQAPFTTLDLLQKAYHPPTADTATTIAQRTGIQRPPVPNNAESMEAALSEPTRLYGQDPSTGVEHNIDYGQLINSIFQNENEPGQVQDPAAVQLAQQQAKGKGGAQKDPPPIPEEVQALYAKYGQPVDEQVKRPDGTVVAKTDGSPVTITHFDDSRTPDKNGAVIGLTPDELEKKLLKLAKDERKKSNGQKAAEKVMSDAINEGLGRRPTSKEVAKLAKIAKLDQADDPQSVIFLIDRELAKLENSTKPDKFVQDALTMWRKAIDDKSESTVTRVAVPEETKKPVKTEAPATAKKSDQIAAPAPQKNPLEVLNKLADQLSNGGKNTVSITDANGKVSTMSRTAYIAKIGSLKGKELTRFQRLTGVDDEGYPVNNPMTHAEIAAAEGVTSTAITKWAKKYGLTEDVVNRAVMEDLETVSVAQESEFKSNAAEGEEASGFSERKNVGELNKGGFHGEEYTARDARNDHVADEFMKTGQVPNTIKSDVDPRLDKAAEDLKAREELAAKTAEANRAAAQKRNFDEMVKTAAKSEYLKEAVQKYDDMRDPEMLEFGRLEPEKQVRWIVMVDADMRTKKLGGKGQPDKDFVELIKAYNHGRKAPAAKPSPAPEGRSGDAEPVRASGGEDGAPSTGAVRAEPAAAPVVTTKKRRVPVKPDAQQSGEQEYPSHVTPRYTAEDLKAEILEFMEVKELPGHMRIVNSTDISKEEAIRVGMHAFTQAWVDGSGNMVMLADRVHAGTGRAVFMHEVGSHLGIDQLFGTNELAKIVAQIEEMKNSSDQLERDVAVAAVERMQAYDGDKSEAVRNSEIIAYFVEEAVGRMHAAGQDVRLRKNRHTRLQRMLGLIIDAIKKVTDHVLGIDADKLTLDDIVDLAYGAARLNLSKNRRIPFHGLQQSAAARKADMEANIKRLPAQLHKPVRGIMATIHDTSRTAMRFAFLPDLADLAARHGMPALKRVAEYTARKGAAKIEMDQKLGAVVKKVQELDKAVKTKAMTYLRDATMSQKWGYQPSWRDTVVVDADEAKKWNALPKDAQEALDAMLKHNDEMWTKKREAIVQMRTALQHEMIADAEARGADKDEIDALWEDMDRLLSDLPVKLDGPYAPLRRFGNYVVTLKSPELLDAEANNREQYLKMLDDPEHYQVEHYDTAYTAANRKAELLEKNPKKVVDYSAKEEHEYLGAGFETLERLSHAIQSRMKGASDEDSKFANATRRALHEAIIQSMGEYNARTSTLQRKNVAGVNPDEMARAFATQGFSDNRFLASVMHNREINEAMVMLRQQTRNGGDRALKQHIYNEMQLRRAKALEAPPSPWVGHAMRFTTIWKLVTSPAYYLQYVSQPATMFLPVIQGRHGYKEGIATLTDSYKTMFAASGGKSFELDLNKIKDANERKMLKELLSTGTIQVGHDQSFGRVETLADNAVSKTWAKATDLVNRLPLELEARNRTASAIAAYRLELKKGASHEKAVEYARDVINQSYGDYTSYSAPSIMQGSGVRKLFFQYRQFQFIHMALLTRLLNNAIRGVDNETKRAARLQLTYMAGHYSVLAGALGVPAAHLLGSAINGVFGDEEDKDVETFVKRHVNNKFAQDMILGGVPRAVFGQDLSGRMGAGDIASPFRYVSVTNALSDKRGYKDTAIAMMGPFVGGMMPQIVDGIDLIGKGDYYRGMEQLLPKGMSDVMKGYRIATEGVVDKKGQTLVPEDEVTAGTVVAQALGSRPTQITSPQHDAFIVSSIAFEFKEEANTLKSKFIKARKAGKPTADIVEDWKDMMKRQKEAGLQPSKLSTLYRAPQAMNKKDTMVLDGVPYSKSTKGLVENVTRGQE